MIRTHLFSAFALPCLLAASAAAQSTFVGQVDATFTIAEGSTTASGVAPVHIALTTDYSSISFELNWDFDIILAGGPDENFETRLEAVGRYYTNDPLNLSFPDANGDTRTANTSLSLESQFSVIERIVTFEDENSSQPIENSATFQSLLFGVGSYPSHVNFRAATFFRELGGLTTSTGEVISLRFSFGNGNSSFNTTLTELLPGDFNSSGLVDAEDFTIWRDVPGFLAPLLTNYSVWRDNYGRSVDSQVGSPANPVPEPSSVALLVLGSIGFAVVVRSRIHQRPNV